MKTIVVFASGSGTNAQKIISYFEKVTDVEVSKVYTNNPNAGVINRAKAKGVSTRVFNRESYKNELLNELKIANPTLVVLAGFLWKIPPSFIDAFPNKIINIHPSLLPKYGGKGMYGKHVFEAIVANNEVETGITIHFVNQYYDEGAIIFQAKTALLPSDTTKIIAEKTHALEHTHFASVIHKLLKNQ
ncbi:MAG: phosphoribosylglycinamide formyltransferase [Flavobacteriaceae bacterium]